jgi:hypothetical protein
MTGGRKTAKPPLALPSVPSTPEQARRILDQPLLSGLTRRAALISGTGLNSYANSSPPPTSPPVQ